MNRSKDAAADRSKTGTDFLQLDRAHAPVGGLAEWLTDQLRDAMADGRLPVGSVLPASRVLAGELAVSRGVVTEAYQRLAEEGQVAARGRAGTTVVGRPIHEGSPLEREDRAPGDAFSAAPSSAVFDALRAAPAVVDLAPGAPDLAAFPRTAWLKAERAVLNELSPAAFGYGDPRGTPALRAAVANWLARYRGITVAPDRVLVVAGVAQALALLARTLRHRGVSAVAVEDPGSLGARQQLQSWGLGTPPIAVDAGGIDVGALRASGEAAVMLTPAHQFPTGVVLDGGRRRDLHRWSDDGGLIIEDDYDAEHRYDRAPVPALRASLPERVCYTGSVSKLLAPALRIGWLLAPTAWHDALVSAKRDSDLGNAVLPQLVLAELMRSGEMERHLRFVRRRHRRRRDAMIAAVDTLLPGAAVHGAAAGLHLLVSFDATFSDIEVAAAALTQGVKVQPLSWHSQRPQPPGFVLGYAASTPTEIEHGVSVLARIVRERTGRPPRRAVRSVDVGVRPSRSGRSAPAPT